MAKRMTFVLLIGLFTLSMVAKVFQLDINEPNFMWIKNNQGYIATDYTVYFFKINGDNITLNKVVSRGEGPEQIPTQVTSLNEVGNEIIITAFPKVFTLDLNGSLKNEEKVTVVGRDLSYYKGQCAGMQYNTEKMQGEYFISKATGEGKKILKSTKIPTNNQDIVNLIIAPASNICMGSKGFYIADGQNSLTVKAYKFSGLDDKTYKWDAPQVEPSQVIKDHLQEMIDVRFSDNPSMKKKIAFPKRLPSYRKLYCQSDMFIFKTFESSENGTKYFITAQESTDSPKSFLLPNDTKAFWVDKTKVYFIEENEKDFTLKSISF